MYRNATEHKIAQLEKKVAFLEELLGIDKVIADKMEKSDFSNKSKTFKEITVKSVKSVGGSILDVNEKSSKVNIMMEDFNEFNIVIIFDLLSESSLARKEVMTYKLNATFIDMAKRRGYYDLSFYLSVDGFPRKDEYLHIKVDAEKGANGIAHAMKDLVNFINKSTLILERM